jgi:hypothetical protein
MASLAVPLRASATPAIAGTGSGGGSRAADPVKVPIRHPDLSPSLIFFGLFGENLFLFRVTDSCQLMRMKLLFVWRCFCFYV